MKKLLLMVMAATMATASLAQSADNPKRELSNKYGFRVESRNHLFWENNNKQKFMAKSTPQEILACKEGSVYGNEYTEETAWVGSACADAGRPGFNMEYYQQFDDCFYKFNEVRFLGYFNYFDEDSYDWIYCHERGAMDDNMEMTKPVTFTIGIYEEDENGLPGKCVMQKDIDIIGERTAVYLEGMGNESSTYVYEFKAELGQEIDLEHGFIQINAKDMGDNPSCWFALFTVGGNLTALQKDVVNEEYSGQMACAFCLYGDGSYNASKAVQLERFMTPSATGKGKYEKVQVELTNIGANTINDVRLELLVDGKVVATENVNATLEQFDSYKYTFNTRVDCSDKEHKITVRNATPGDELKARQTISMTTEAPVTDPSYPTCETRVPNTINITKVTVGSIDNASAGSTYSDYTDQKTTFHVGDTQVMNVTIEASDYDPAFGIFIDWNGDYQFSSDEAVTIDQFTTNGSITQAVATVSMPQNAVVGEHRMRLVAVPYYYDPNPAESYYLGEIEDYTVVVEPKAGDPIFNTDNTAIEKDASSNTGAEVTMSNEGNGILTANVDVNYVLPDAPTSNYSEKVAPRGKFNGKLKAARKATGKLSAPEASSDTEYVLKYDSDKNDCIGIGNSANATFANYFTGKMLGGLRGMKISSVDVYIGDLPESASIVIYGQNKQTECGDLLAEKKFLPVKDSWNHVVLDTPIEIANTDLWVGVKMTNIKSTGYYIGVDNGPAVTGFGDVVNIGGNIWWSMADLGLDYNYCIRANVTGTRTAAINWLSVDKETLTVAPHSTEKLNISFAPQALSDGLYEAYVDIRSNDPLVSHSRIPVYLIKGDLTDIDLKENAKPGITFNGSTLVIKGDKTMAGVSVSDIAGRIVMNTTISGNEAVVDLSAYGKGVYIVTTTYADGTSMSVKANVTE